MDKNLRTIPKQRGQGLLEFALALPFLLLLLLGVFEFGRIVFIYSSANNASREAARFGAATGFVPGSVQHYLACDAIRDVARKKAFLAGLEDSDIQIGYDRPNTTSNTMVGFAHCEDGLSSDDIKVGDRIVVTVTADIDPILSILPLPTFSPTFVTARTILKSITVGPVECSDGEDNDNDGSADFGGTDKLPPDTGCSGPNDTTEASCYSLAVFGQPTSGGNINISPSANCANSYIENTKITLEAIPATKKSWDDTPRDIYRFENWTDAKTDSTLSSANPYSFFITSNTDINGNFHLLQADLRVSKDADQSTVGSLQVLTYTVTITNTGPDTAHHILITDTLPAETTFQPLSSSPECMEQSGNVLCQIDQLLLDQSVELEIVVVTPVTSYSNLKIVNEVTASAFEPDPSPTNTAVITTTVYPLVDLSITKEGPPGGEVDANSQFNYTITVTNTGPSWATGVVITDTLPAGLEFLGPQPQCSAQGDPLTGQKVKCDLPDMNALRTEAVSLLVRAPVEGTVGTNVAEVWSDEEDSDPINNFSNLVDTKVNSVADLSVSKTGPPTAVRDQPFSYQITVFNDGPSQADVVITDTVTGNVEFDLPGNCGEVGGGTITCTVGIMTSGAMKIVNFDVIPREEGTLVNRVEVGSITKDDDLSNNDNFDDPFETVVSAVVDLDWVDFKRGGPSLVVPGETFTYTLRIGNNGPSDATGVEVLDQLDGALTFKGFKGAGWSCQNTSPLRCTYNNLAQDEWSTVLSIRVTLDAGTIQKTITNSGTVSAIESDSNSGNDTADWSADVGPPPPGVWLPDGIVVYIKPTFSL